MQRALGTTRTAALLALLLLVCGCGDLEAPFEPSASTLGHVERGAIYGGDDRFEVFEQTDPALQGLAETSLAALISGRSLDLSVPNTVRVLGRSLGSVMDLCDGERFFDQPVAAFCSGVLIDSDLVLTAAHCVETQANCAATFFVFRHYYESPGQLTSLSDVDVHTCRKLLVHRLQSTHDPSLPSLDYAIVQLDRPVAAHLRPAPVRATQDALAVGSSVTIIGFPGGIPAKIDDGGHVIAARPQIMDRFVATTDSFGGNSGSPVFDEERQLVGVLVSGASDYVALDSCNVAAQYPDDGSSGGEESCYIYRPIEELCAMGWPSQRLCGTGPACGDDMCTGIETAHTCAADCPTPYCGDRVCDRGEWTTCSDCEWAPPPPESWVCHPGYYATQDGCDCACGAYDPDCADVSQTVFGCPGGSCDGAGRCVGGVIGWTCPSTYYGASDGCDCECGLPDPDCGTESNIIYGCGAGQECDSAGHCIGELPLPATWTCASGTYGTGDGCDCDCGAVDPDCSDPEQAPYGCPLGMFCDSSGHCVGVSPSPSGWVCLPSRYDAADGCHCACGIYDPDCDDPNQPVIGCGVAQWCDLAGRCIGGSAVPGQWSCPPEFYAALDGCNCACGAYDPDCDDPNQGVLHCPSGQRCGLDGRCTSFSSVPTQWTCAPKRYASRSGCDCACGAPDPDCALDGQAVLNCEPGQVCAAGLCVRPMAEVPETWACLPECYASSDGCHCVCGAPDPDCDDPQQPVLGCPPGARCDSAGACASGGATGGAYDEATSGVGGVHADGTWSCQQRGPSHGPRLPLLALLGLLAWASMVRLRTPPS